MVPPVEISETVGRSSSNSTADSLPLVLCALDVVHARFEHVDARGVAVDADVVATLELEDEAVGRACWRARGPLEGLVRAVDAHPVACVHVPGYRPVGLESTRSSSDGTVRLASGTASRVAPRERNEEIEQGERNERVGDGYAGRSEDVTDPPVKFHRQLSVQNNYYQISCAGQ